MTQGQQYDLLIISVLLISSFLISAIVIGLGRHDAKKKKEQAEKVRLQKLALEAERKALIKKFVQSGQWTRDIAQAVYKRQLAIDMDENMVMISWGTPDDKDKIEILKSGSKKERWVYGEKGRGADYISFKDGKVTKIQMRN